MEGLKGNSTGGTTPRIAELEAILRRQPGSKFFASLAEEHIKSGNYPEAVAVCRRGLSHNPGFVKGQLMMVRALYHQGQYSEAKAELERVIAANPRDGEPMVVWGELLLSTGDVQKARDCLEKALKVSPRHKRASKMLAELPGGDVGEMTLPASDMGRGPWSDDTSRQSGPSIEALITAKVAHVNPSGGPGAKDSVWGDETLPLRAVEQGRYNPAIKTEEITTTDMEVEEDEDEDDDEALIGVPQHAVLPKNRRPSSFGRSQPIGEDLLNLQELMSDDPSRYRDDGIKTQRMMVRELKLPRMGEAPQSDLDIPISDNADDGPFKSGLAGFIGSLSPRDRLVLIVATVAIVLAILVMIIYLAASKENTPTVETSISRQWEGDPPAPPR